MQIFEEKKECSGCTACKYVCPVNAITIQPDNEGFLYPFIDQGICINCGLCLQVCPMKRAAEVSPAKQTLCFAAISTNENNRIKSSSGGIFTPLSDYVFSQQGLAAGALFDDELTVIHALTDNCGIRDKMKGSKYVQSDLQNVFRSVEAQLLNGKTILFTGTPCQADGLRAYINAKKIDTANLFLCDLLCLGSPSPKIFKEYLSYLENKYQERISDFHFRTKIQGWKKMAASVRFENNVINHDDEINTKLSFLKIYSSLMVNRPSCYSCPYTRYERNADLTLGDFWTVRSSVPEMDDDKGTSLVLVHSDKGEALLNSIKGQILLKEISKKDAWSLALEKPRSMPRKRDIFWENYQEKGIEYVIRLYGKGTLFVNIIHKISPFLRKTGIYDAALRIQQDLQMSLRIIVIIPAFNEQDSILKTVNLLKNSCPTVDYIVVNDGSTDNTKNLLKQNNIHHLNLPINLGIGGAVQTGYLYALENDYDIAVQFDGDGQHDANFISALVQPLIDNEADLVIGSRFIDHEGFQSTKSRRAGIGILRSVIQLTTGKNIKDPTSGFRAVNKRLINYFSENYAQDYPEPESIVTVLRFGCIVKEVPVLMCERESGTSSINLLNSIYYMFRVTIAILLNNLIKTKKQKR